MNEPADSSNGITRTDELLRRLLLTREEVGELLGIPEETVQNLHRTKQLPAVKVGKFCRCRPETVRTFVESLDPED